MTAGLALGILSACRQPAIPPPSQEWITLKNEAWGIELKYPVGWAATVGDAFAPLAVELRAPGHEATVGAGASVVAAYSAAPPAEVGRKFFEDTKNPAPVAAEATVGGYPALVYVYDRRQGEETVMTRLVIVRAPERYFFITFAAYEPQWETTRPIFDEMERSIVIR